MWLILKGKTFYFNEAMVTYRAQSIGSFTQRVHHSLEYAQSILNGMNRFSEIQYMKNRELYIYYMRIGNYYACLETPFYKSMKLAKRIRAFLIINYRRLKSVI